MNKTIIHPINENPPIQAYQMRNFELSILLGHNPNIMPWLFNKFINCLYKINTTSSISFDHTTDDGRWYKLEGVMHVNKIKFDKSIKECECFNILKITKEMISVGYYFMGYLDEYYISSKLSYNNRHFRHSNLIYGYDDDKNLFYAIGYTLNKKYEKFVISYEEFINSIQINYDKNESYHKTNIERIEYDFVKINEKFEYKINIHEIYENLYDYMHSINTRYDRRKFVYGRNCVKIFLEYMQNVKSNKSTLDERASRFFMELKNLMFQRIVYLKNNNYINIDISDIYKAIDSSQTIIHNLFIKYNISRQESLIDKMIKYQEEIMIMENEILPRLLDELHKYMQTEQNNNYRSGVIF